MKWSEWQALADDESSWADHEEKELLKADASLVAVAESHSFRRIFTLDSHFHAYRLAAGSALEIVR